MLLFCVCLSFCILSISIKMQTQFLSLYCKFLIKLHFNSIFFHFHTCTSFPVSIKSLTFTTLKSLSLFCFLRSFPFQVFSLITTTSFYLVGSFVLSTNLNIQEIKSLFSLSSLLYFLPIYAFNYNIFFLYFFLLYGYLIGSCHGKNWRQERKLIFQLFSRCQLFGAKKFE